MNPSPSTFQGHPQQHWNSMPPPIQNAHAHQRQHRALSNSANNPSKPGFHASSPHSFQGRNRSQTTNSTVHARKPTPKHDEQPVAASRLPTPSASTSQPNRSDTTSSKRISENSNVQKEADKDITNTTVSRAAPILKEDVDKIACDQQFEWDMAYSFLETPLKETMRLACPLSISFVMAPVRLLSPQSTIPVSRFVRNITVTDFAKSVREGPNWSALKVDPAFTELNTDSPLIPIDEIPRWMAQRQGLTEYIESSPAASRKRTRPEEVSSDNEKGVSDSPVVQTVEPEPQEKAPPSKRQKNQEPDQDMSECGTPVTAILTYEARDGTPCLMNDDEAWAPEPGERAGSPEDPTEALLASLGVTGVPKPVCVNGLLAYQPVQEDTEGILKTQSSFSHSKQKNKIGVAHATHIEHAQNGQPQRSPDEQASLQSGTNGPSEYSQDSNYTQHNGQPHQHFPQTGFAPQYNNGPPGNHFAHPQAGDQNQNQVFQGNNNRGQHGYHNQYTNQEAISYQNGVNGNTGHTVNNQAQYGTFNQNLTQNGDPTHGPPHYGSATVQHGNVPNGHHQIMNGPHGTAIGLPHNHQYGPGPGPLSGNNFDGQGSNSSVPLVNNGPLNHFRNGTRHNNSTPNPVSNMSMYLL
jgi:hypothetical protein